VGVSIGDQTAQLAYWFQFSFEISVHAVDPQRKAVFY
jgi:hypothetical protein